VLHPLQLGRSRPARDPAEANGVSQPRERFVFRARIASLAAARRSDVTSRRAPRLVVLSQATSMRVPSTVGIERKEKSLALFRSGFDCVRTCDPGLPISSPGKMADDLANERTTGPDPESNEN
jgi:hypothetical protein